jgi:hypothetical protein
MAIDPLIIQKRLAHVGDIRTGTRTEKGYPTKLTTFRITTPHQDIAEEIADLYGGEPTPWEDGYEVLTTTNTLPVRVHPQDFDPFLEVWSKGGLQKRCTGTTEYTTDYPPKKLGPCPGTTPDNRRECSFGCKPTTRISVILDDSTIVGSFTARTTSFNANREITQAMTIIAQQWRGGEMFPQAVLELRQETRVSKGQTTKFGVLTLRPIITNTIREMLGTPQALHPSGRPILPQDQPPIPDDTKIIPELVDAQPSGPSVAPLPPPTPPMEISVPGGSGSNGGDATAQLPLTGDVPPPLPDNSGGGADIKSGSKTPPPTSDASLAALDELTEWLQNPPNDADTVKLLEVKLRTAYTLTTRSGLIPDDGDPTPLVNRAVTKYGKDHNQPDAFHVGDLRKADLRALTEKTFTYLQGLVRGNG